MESQFFLSGDGSNMGRIQNSPGSILHKIGITCGIPNLSPTMVRQAAETFIQNNLDMRKKSKVLNNHEPEVGLAIYDGSGARIRSEFINHINAIESPFKKKPLESDFDVEREKLMLQMEKNDESSRLQEAKEFLEAERINQQRNQSNKRIKVGSIDRALLQTILFEDMFHSVKKDFPDLQRWKLLWTRFIDSYTGSPKRKEELLRIEKKIFEHVQKEMEEENGSWCGTRKENSIADMKIATHIYNCLRSYERGLKRQGSFFNFKRR